MARYSGHMALELSWVGLEAASDVALARARAYGAAAKEYPRFLDQIREDQRASASDYLLALDAGQAVGTATCLPLAMWMRGVRFQCQGIAWVGTIKTHRRRPPSDAGAVATQILHATLRRARECGDVLSALMPFRGSFYEHFGYGVVERRNQWTIPLELFHGKAGDGIRFMTAGDADAVAACRQRQVEQGQCDLARSAASWTLYRRQWEDGLVVVDASAEGLIAGYLAFTQSSHQEKDLLIVSEAVYHDAAGLRRLLAFLSTLRDQASSARLTLAANVPVNRLLREVQLPHRPVNHRHATLNVITRMSIRVLDHVRLLEAMSLGHNTGRHRSGRAVVSIRETEGNESRLALDFQAGRCIARPTQSTAEFTCDDKTWAAVVSGDLSASQAVFHGLADAESDSALQCLDAFSDGPPPFTQEYF